MISFESNSCLLVIDIQGDNKKVYNYKQLKKNICKLIEFAREKNILIYYIFFIRNHNSYWYNFKKELMGEISEEGLPLDFIVPNNSEEIIFKTAYDSFFNTDLDKLLKEKNIKTLYICGVLTGVCVLNTIFTGFNSGYRIVVIENCCSDKSKKRHKDVFDNYSNYLFITENI